MTNFPNKTAITLVALLVIGTAIGALHNRALESGRSFFIRDVIRLALTPVDIASHRVFAAGGWFVGLFRPHASIVRENARLREEVQRLTEENARLREAAEENIRLRRALALTATQPPNSINAEVISRRLSSWFDTATINRGTRAGVVNGSAVANFRGLVGQVVETDAFSAQVMALTDAGSAVGAMVQRSRSSGILQGQGADYLTLTYLPKDADIKESDIVVSSGKGRVIPKGLVIGRVVRVVRNSVASGTSALVRPSVRFDELEHVLVIKPGQGGGK